MKRIIIKAFIGFNVAASLLSMSSGTIGGACVGLALLVETVLIGRHYALKGYFDDVEE